MSDAFIDLSACKDRATRVVELVTEIERLRAELKTYDIIHGGESQLSFFIRRAKEMEEKADRLRVENQKLQELNRTTSAAREPKVCRHEKTRTVLGTPYDSHSVECVECGCVWTPS